MIAFPLRLGLGSLLRFLATKRFLSVVVND